MNVYRIDYSNKLIKKEITRKTESSIFYLNIKGKEERSAINNSYCKWCDTPQEAINDVIERAEKEVKDKENILKYYQERLEKTKLELSLITEL